MGSSEVEPKLSRLVQDTALAPRERLQKLGIGPCKIRSASVGCTEYWIHKVVALFREMFDPRFGIVLEDISRAFGSERIDMSAKRGEHKAKLTHAFAPDRFKIDE